MGTIDNNSSTLGGPLSQSGIGKPSFQIPGDDIASSFWWTDEAVHITASASQIWPWLVQMGTGRGGWYSYDIIDNLGRSSANTILAEFQDLKKGTKLGIITVEDLEAPLFITYQFSTNTNMTYFIKQQNGECQLITRVRWVGLSVLAGKIFNVGHRFMQAKQFQELKTRCER